MGDVVIDTYGEVIFWFGFLEVVVNRLHHRRSEFFGGKSVASAYYADCVRGPDEGVRRYTPGFVQCVDYIYIQWFANGSAFLGAIQDRDLANGFGEGFHE